MKRFVLFSEPGKKNKNHEKVMKAIFPEELGDKRMLYMPSGGVDSMYQHYYDEWREICKRYSASFELIDNGIQPDEIKKIEIERKKIESSNIVVITGGDPFKLLYHLRRTGLDQSIIDFTKKKEFVLAGFSAGAMILTPTIAITTMDVTNQEGKRVPIHDVREKSIHPGLNNDLTGLKLVDFEIVPHFEEKYANDVELYRKLTKNEVKTCTDDEYFIIEK